MCDVDDCTFVDHCKSDFGLGGCVFLHSVYGYAILYVYCLLFFENSGGYDEP